MYLSWPCKGAKVQEGLQHSPVTQNMPLCVLSEHHIGDLSSCYLQVVINWCIAQGTVPIPGAKSLRNAQDNINSLSWSLSTAEVNELCAMAEKSPRGMVQNIFQTN